MADIPTQESEVYNLGALIEDTLTAPFRVNSLFQTLASKPPPGYALMCANFSLYWTAMCGVNFLRAIIMHPAALKHHSPLLMAIIGVAALIIIVLISFLNSAILHVLALISGGKGGYTRSYQIISVLSLLAPLQALFNWIPMLWMLPTILGAYLTIVAVEDLHHCPALRARIVFGLVFALALAGRWYVHGRVEKLARQYEAITQISRDLNSIKQSPESLTQTEANKEVSPQASGLDMILKPSINTAPGPETGPQQAKAIEQAQANMLGSLLPMLNNPKLTKNMPPQQAKTLQELVNMISEQQSQIQSGKSLSPEERDKMMKKFQQLTVELMKTLPQNASPAVGNQENQP